MLQRRSWFCSGGVVTAAYRGELLMAEEPHLYTPITDVACGRIAPPGCSKEIGEPYPLRDEEIDRRTLTPHNQVHNHVPARWPPFKSSCDRVGSIRVEGCASVYDHTTARPGAVSGRRVRPPSALAAAAVRAGRRVGALPGT